MTKSPVFFETGKPILQEHKTASFIFFKVIFFLSLLEPTKVVR